ncbi:hypothetical protein [Paenibacillus kobensis]|uniref:hypothetical protein n=1 Tax=Paenibacillus kobensis TaxID=59841 RepID=UPI000FDBB6C9|nr:hypothetical protein [Paenibacillus kobensis]
MKKVSVVLIRICVLSLIVGLFSACSLVNEQKEEVQAEYSVHPELIKDRDSLIEKIRQIDDYDAVTYTEKQLTDMRNVPESKSYKHVLVSFVEDELQKKIESYQSIGEESNELFHTFAVITQDQFVYKIILTKKDEIWVTSSVAQFFWKEYSTS